MFEVVDTAFNREHAPNLIGQKFDCPPSYVQVMPAFKSIKVYFDDGDWLTTQIRGTEQEILQYYIGKLFEKRDETMHKAIKVEFICT